MSMSGVKALQSRIDNVIKIHRTAGDVTGAEAIGLLEIIKLDMYQELLEASEDVEDWKEE